jgi:hypothetical protein
MIDLKVTIRQLSAYKDVRMTCGNIINEIGMLNDDQQKELAEILREAADELYPIEQNN